MCWVSSEKSTSTPMSPWRFTVSSGLNGFCAGPRVDSPVVRPCPPCLVDLRRLERRASEDDRIRRAIEARAEAGIAEAQALGDHSLLGRARERRRWVWRLREAGPDDLYAALLAAFTRAFERWHAPAA